MRPRSFAAILVALLLVVPLAQAVTFGNAQSTGGNTNANTKTVTKPSGTSAGHFLLAQVVTDKGSGVTITPPSGWTLLGSQNHGSAVGQSLYYKVATASEPASYGWSFSQNVRSSVGIVRYTDVNTTDPFDGTPTATTADGTTITLPSITTTAAGSLVVAVVGSEKSTSFTPASGMTERYDRNGAVTATHADVAMPTAGASGAKTFTAASGGKLAGGLVALRKAPTPALSLDKASSAAWEANGTVRFWANLSLASQLTVTAQYTVTGTASGGGVDYTLASGTLTFSAGQTAKGINATIVNDAIAEANETIVITLSGLTNATAGGILSATHTIVNDDATVGFQTTGASVAEAVGAHPIVVALGGGSPRTVGVTYTVAAGTAVSGSDYSLASGSLSFAPWETSKTLNLSVVGDTLDEPDETLSVTLSAPTNALLGTAVYNVTIADDDALPAVAFPAPSASFGEAASPSVTVSLSTASGRTVRVPYSTSAGTATVPADLAPASGTLTYAPGETSKAISLSLVKDTLDEVDETFTIALGAPENATLGTSQLAVTIVDDDAPPTVSFSGATSSGPENGALPSPGVVLSGASSLSVSVVVSVSGGSADGSDFTGGAASLVFAPGETSKSVALASIDDAVLEHDETILLSLASPANATVGSPSTHVLTLLDDEAPISIRFAQADASALEAAGARSALVTLSGASAPEIKVNYTWSGGSAVAGEDYSATAGQLVFAPGATQLSIPFTLVNDEIVEADETIVLTLTDAVNATLASPTHTFTILNDDAPYPSVGIQGGDSSAPEATPATPLVVALSAPDTRVVTVSYAVGGTATFGADHSLAAGSLTFAPGETQKEIPYSIVDDAVVEPDETIVVSLFDPVRATLGAWTSTRTIRNDDVPPPVVTFAAADSTVSETAPTLALRVQLDAPAPASASVQYAVTGGTATGGGVDFDLPSGTLTFEAGQSTRDIVLALSDDAIVEPGETIVVTLSSPVAALLGGITAHTVTLTSDDVAAITLAFAASSSAASEATGAISLVVLASATTLESYEVSYGVTGGTASQGVDYVLAAGTLLFEPGQTSQAIPIEIVNDPDHEPDETLVVALSNPSFGSLGSPATHVLTIQNDDAPPPTLAWRSSATTVVESAGTVSIPVTLSPAAAATATVAYAATGGTATLNTDYTLAAGTLTFAAGETTKHVAVTLIDDPTPEAGETVVITLSNPSGALLGASEHILTIANDDSPLPIVQWNLTASTVSEGAGTATIRAYLGASSAATVSVGYSVTGGTASGAGADYTLATGALTFSPGETSKAVTVTIVDDALVEGDETAILTLSNPLNATLGTQTSHTLTILENDVATSTVVTVFSTPVLPDGSPHTGATWGGWSAEPGATNVLSTNYLKLVNTGTTPTPRVVVSFSANGFVGANDSSSVVPTASNLQFAWWEDTTPSVSSPSEGTFTFGAVGASPSVTLSFTGTGRVIYVAYRIVQMPDVLAQQSYAGSFTVTEL